MRIRNFLWLLVLASLWGPSFLFIKIAVDEIPPLTMVVGRVGLASMLLLLILRIQGRWLPPFGPIWKHIAIVALVHNALPFTLFAWGEQHIDSALAAILNGTTPLFTILLAHVFTADDRITPPKLLGVLIGFGGVLVLIGPSLFGGVQATALGLLAITVAAALYGVAIVYTRIHLRGLPPLVAPAAQLMLAALYLLPFSLLFEQPFSGGIPSWPALGAMFALTVFGTALAFVLYYAVMARTSATYVSMVTYMIPVIGVILGVFVLDEQLQWNAYLGCALILGGVMIVNRRQKARPSSNVYPNPQPAPHHSS
jgi:drug/metabolite transporter (DMT)-like permease